MRGSCFCMGLAPAIWLKWDLPLIAFLLSFAALLLLMGAMEVR